MDDNGGNFGNVDDQCRNEYCAAKTKDTSDRSENKVLTAQHAFVIFSRP